jgi:HAD superfamily hydrolase (TIGR01509 family)
VAIRAVCFDLGGVVARISYHWAEMLERCGIQIPDYIRPGDDIHKMPTFEKYQAGELTDAQYLHDLAVYLGGLTFEQARAVHASMLIEPFPGVLEIVEELNETGMVTGCLSNTNAPHWVDLAESGRFPAIQAMQVRLASHLIDVAKPDPRAFTTFEEATWVEPSQILLFDDSHVNCQAARDLGWSAERIDPTGDTAGQMRRVLETLGALAR